MTRDRDIKSVCRNNVQLWVAPRKQNIDSMTPFTATNEMRTPTLIHYIPVRYKSLSTRIQLIAVLWMRELRTVKAAQTRRTERRRSQTPRGG